MPQTTQPCSSSHVVVETSAGTIINGGLRVDTFTPGTGYDGSNHGVVSAQDYQNGFNAFGSSANYAGLACRVTVNYNTNIGQGFDSNGDLLWTDTYSSLEQFKAAELTDNVVTGVNSYFCELKGGLGSTTFMTAPPATGSFGARPVPTGLLDSNSLDVAYAGQGDDEFTGATRPAAGASRTSASLWLQHRPGRRPQPQPFATAGFAGVRHGFAGANDLVNWANVSPTGTGDTVVQFDKSGSGNFTQIAVTLKIDSLFGDFGVTDHSSIGAQQVVQDMDSTGHLVLSHTH